MDEGLANKRLRRRISEAIEDVQLGASVGRHSRDEATSVGDEDAGDGQRRACFGINRFFRGTKLPRVHRGFLHAYMSIRAELCDALHDIYVRGAQLPFAKHNLIVCGHSLGGALATIAAYDLVNYGGGYEQLRFSADRLLCVSFGSPRIGDRAFAARFDQSVRCSFRWAMRTDIITKLPVGGLGGYKHVGQLVMIDEAGTILLDPSPVERSWGLAAPASIGKHLTPRYAAAMKLWIVRYHGRDCSESDGGSDDDECEGQEARTGARYASANCDDDDDNQKSDLESGRRRASTSASIPTYLKFWQSPFRAHQENA